MKKNIFRRLIFSALTLLTGLSAGRASAQIYAQDDAAGYSTGTGNSAWISGDNTNGGFGFLPWTFTTIGPGYQGFYVGNLGAGSPVASTNGNVWGMYANTGDGNAAVAYRGFTNSLAPGTVFKIKWKCDGVSASNPNALAGFCLRNGNSDASTADYNNGFRLMFYYLGNNTDSFLVWDGSGVYLTDIPFDSNPLQIEVTLLTADTYRLVIKDASGANTLAEFDNQSLSGSGTIDSLSLFAFDTEGNQIFNNLQIESTSLVPPEIVNLSPTNGSIYISAENPFSFEVTSGFSTVSSDNVKLILNGVDQSGSLSITGGGTSDLHATLNPPLQVNTVYTGTITVTDDNGNYATNNFSFNTWLPSPENIFIEAEDYNYGSGLWIDNFATPQPNQAYGQYDLLGINGTDYLNDDLTGTNHPNAYRAGDLPEVETSTDVDHDNFFANGFQDYDLDYIQNGEWEDYTRQMSNVTYAVYARMSAFGGNPTMLMERTASPTVNSADQPRASLGTFICPQTGDAQNWTFVPLKDFFSNPVLVNFAGTNTFRLTDIGGSGSYNVNYLVFVALTNTATLRPYIASGFPYPGAEGVAPDQTISFTIANRQTSVGSVQLFLNSTDVTSGVVFSNNAAGTVVNYHSPTLLTPGTNTMKVVFSDGAISQTNSWQFIVADLPVLSPAWALPAGSLANSGFALQIAKADDNSTNVDFPPTVARAEAQLAGTLTNSITGEPYTNIALNNGSYIETNVINYAVDPFFYGILGTTNAFPDLPAGGTNDLALAAQMYVQLSPGIYNFGVYSDDGFKLTAGSTPADTNLVLGVADYGRAGTETSFSFIVETNGLYPMRLIYFKSQFNGGGVELYSINRANGTRVLLNDPTNPNSIKVYYAPATIRIAPNGTNLVLTWDDATYSLQAAPQVTGVYTNVPGAKSPYSVSTTEAQQFFRLVKP